MMGLQATPGKRKLEAAAAPGDSSPPKAGRWEADDCIARLQAVAVPGDAWRSPTPSSLAATLLSDADYDEDDEFDDELSSDDDRLSGVGGVPEPARFTPPQAAATAAPPQPHPNGAFANGRYHHHPNAAPNNVADYWQYYQPPQQQTIRCDENGKSYLELGASPPQLPPARRCCDGRTRWCHVPCYRQRRLAVLNLSMCKLARYRQCSDPSLRRSVLICNTLRRLEREMEAEPPEPSFELQPPPPQPRLQHPQPEHLNHQQQPAAASSYEQSLREMTCSSGRATPFPVAAPLDTDSGLGDDDSTRPINWGSVLSLTSQTDLESLNNNELYAELGLSSDPPEMLWKDPTPPHMAAGGIMMPATNDSWGSDGFIMVGGT